MKNAFREIVEDCPVIATVKDIQSMEKSFESDSQIIFILFGDICSIASIVDRVKRQGRTAMVHLDLVSGFDGRETAVDYIKNMTRADGIISTKTTQINRAKELGLYAVHRFFVLDSRSLENIRKQSAATKPDCIEILPGIMPKIITRVTKAQRIPVIAGGMIDDKEDVMLALKAGATAISTTKQELLSMAFLIFLNLEAIF